jgi:chitin disaccharide deacetylase
MIYLIVNGDDLGLRSAVNAGIMQAGCHGILRSASIMANGAGFKQACRQIESAPHLAIGLHVTLTHGQPVMPAREVASLVDQNGHFWNKWPFLLRGQLGLLQARHMAAEVQAQFERVRQMGIELSHVDSHHHVHLLPHVGRVVHELAARYRLTGPRSFIAVERPRSYKARFMLAMWHQLGKRLPLPVVDKPEIRFAGAELYWARDKRYCLMEYVEQLSSGFHELMCHPALVAEGTDAALQNRVAECEALCDIRIREVIEHRRIQLISYREL